MTETNESEFEAWQEDVEFLVKILADVFESTDYRYYLDEMNQTLYIELEGLGEFEENEIEELAGPVFDELDLDFEDIILVPLDN
ncbi:MAG: hypothetical protein WD035_03645 [Balneolaceae bacterium]